MKIKIKRNIKIERNRQIKIQRKRKIKRKIKRTRKRKIQIQRKSKSRLNSSLEIKLIDENARWIKTIRDNDVYQLNFDKYSQNIDLNELESKRFEDLSDYQSDLTFEPLLYELPIMEQDSVFKINRNRWHENLAKDIYMEEALNVLNDLKNSYSTNNTAQLKD